MLLRGSISSSAYGPGWRKEVLLKTLKMSYVGRRQPFPLIQQTNTFLKLISPKLTSSPTLVPSWNPKSIHRYALLLSLYVVWSRTPVYPYVLTLSLIMTLSPVTPACLGILLLPVDPEDSCFCIWYASRTGPSLNSRKGNGEIWIENTTVHVRIWMSAGAWAYHTMAFLYRRDWSGFASHRALSGHLLQIQIRPAPRGELQEQNCVRDEEL